MTNFSHGHIIPLVGGSVIGTSAALGNDPQWIASWGKSFGANDKYCLEYYKHIPYYELDEGKYPNKYVDIITCLPPCAGLSLANVTTRAENKNPRGCNAPSNMHMYHASEFAMSKLRPKAIMVENAPMLFSKGGEQFAERINALANKYGYTMNLIKTTSLHHGIPQERTRSFFFLWNGKEVPIFNPINRYYEPFYKVLENSSRFHESELVSNKPSPSSDPLWQFIESKFVGQTKQEILSKVASTRMTSAWSVIYENGWLPEAAGSITDEKAKRWLNYTLQKKSNNLNIMDGSLKLAWHRTQALMWKSLPMLMHPHEDRWLTVAEGLALMGFPDDYASKVSIPTKHSNVICQNVPACTARDWATEIAEALSGNRAWVIPPKDSNGQTKILRQSNLGKNPMVVNWSL